MRWLPAARLMPTPPVICGSRPMATNSVVPIAKPPSASANSARASDDGRGGVKEGARVVRGRGSVVTVTSFLIATFRQQLVTMDARAYWAHAFEEVDRPGSPRPLRPHVRRHRGQQRPRADRRQGAGPGGRARRARGTRHGEGRAGGT